MSIGSQSIPLVKNALFASVVVARGTKDMRLAIGAPSSPALSNAALFEFDQKMREQSKAIDPESTITRYADDIVFSTDRKGLCDTFVDDLKSKVISRFSFLNLSLNHKKTSFMSRGTRRMIGGLIVCPDGSVSIGRKRKRYVRKLLNDLRYGNLSNEEKEKLRGLLAFINDVEPDYLNNLSMKYTAALVAKARAA